MTKPWLIVPFLLLLLSCAEDNTALSGNFAAPEHAAAEFFDAIYNQNDLELAKSLSSQSLAELIEHYATPRQVARTVINMSYDEVTINVNRAGQNLREQYGDATEVMLVFTGTFDNRTVNEMRVVRMVRVRGRWLVDEILNDPYSKVQT
ncbi:hypothetical protein Q3O60_14220 [Alkalimonas collagenimarina]|uniref:DUF3828 domain-containing protein n=1 Tax=Alkalimonas collagenimarina TaxID=400390 RepID=A0ABT9H206_9GAMM|nr:hypothetical protein [Alkalimonas collagenimarina]MDP4537345.1 hypothetical protein [Alkalimonas collagenimarina]